MTDYHFGDNLLSLYAQLTPWVQAWLGFALCLVVLGGMYLLKEIVVAITQPFLFPRALQKALADHPYGEWKQFQKEILQKLNHLLTRSILSSHLGIR